MNAYPIIAILIGLLVVVMLAVMFIVYRRRGELPETDYRVFFILGLTWLPLGIATDNPSFWGLGAVFLIAGLANRDKWKDSASRSGSTLSSRRVQLLVGLGLALLLTLVTVLYLINQG